MCQLTEPMIAGIIVIFVVPWIAWVIVRLNT